MEEKEVCYHVPVMLHESLEGLDIQPSGVYVDVTFGGGGHSREILNRLNDEGELYGFDQDADAEKNIPADSRFVFVRSNFRYLYNFMRYHGVAGEVDGLLADLGVSSHHFDDSERGFSFRFFPTTSGGRYVLLRNLAYSIIIRYVRSFHASLLQPIGVINGDCNVSVLSTALICWISTTCICLPFRRSSATNI